MCTSSQHPQVAGWLTSVLAESAHVMMQPITLPALADLSVPPTDQAHHPQGGKACSLCSSTCGVCCTRRHTTLAGRRSCGTRPLC